MTNPTTFRVALEKKHRGCCPYCGCTMVPGAAKDNRPFARSKAHLLPLWHKDRDGHAYVYACRRCNGEQANLTLDEWLILLIYRGDRREGAVTEVVKAAVGAGLMKLRPILADILGSHSQAAEGTGPTHRHSAGSNPAESTISASVD